MNAYKFKWDVDSQTFYAEHPDTGFVIWGTTLREARDAMNKCLRWHYLEQKKLVEEAFRELLGQHGRS